MKKIPCEIYSRVVGYFRPVKQWNLGKKSEFEDRKELDIGKMNQPFDKEKHGKNAK